MAFKLYKASGARVPDLVSDIGAGATFGASSALVVNGVALFLDTDGLEVAATSNAVAGICAVEYGATTYAAGGSATFPLGFAADTKVPFLPVTGTVPFKADVEGTVAIGGLVVGTAYDIAGSGLTIGTGVVNGDFRIVKLIDDGTNITHVVGFFVNPGYFTA